jgi:phosphatidylglycerol lysyltransferase
MPPHIPVRGLWWLAAGGAGYGARYLRLRLKVARRPIPADPSHHLLRLHTLYGYNPHALVSIAPGAREWSMPEIDGAIIYSDFGRVWLAAGDPLAKPGDTKTLAKGFMTAARKAKCTAAFVPATERFAREAAPLGLSVVKVGAAPYFDMKNWNPRGDRAKKMRAGVNQATRAGVKVEIVEHLDDALKHETAKLCLDWLKTRPAATTFGWLLALDPFLHADRKRLFAARDSAGTLVGFLAASAIPERDGWYLEDVLREPNAPQGTADLLVVEVLHALAREGARLATLGTAPLAKEGEDDISTHDHPVIERALSSASKRLGAFYHFEGLRRFKAKFAPSWWESEYVLVQKGVMVPTRVAPAILRAIVPGGLTQLLTRKVVQKIRF